MAAPDDAALDARLTHLRQADPARFLEELFKTFYAPLGAVAYRVMPDRAVVKDLLQDVFLRLWQGLDTLPPIASHRAYLTRMALNAALRYRQRDQRQMAWDEAAEDSVEVSVARGRVWLVSLTAPGPGAGRAGRCHRRLPPSRWPRRLSVCRPRLRHCRARIAAGSQLINILIIAMSWLRKSASWLRWGRVGLVAGLLVLAGAAHAQTPPELSRPVRIPPGQQSLETLLN